MSSGPIAPGSPSQPTPTPSGPSNVLGAESVRASGGPAGNQAWQQDLATFAGGQFQRPSGNLSFNPLSPTPFGGAATGAGNAPVMGMPTSLLQQALGGGGFSATNADQVAPQSNNNVPSGPAPSSQDWLDRYLGGGRMMLQ